MMNVDNLTDAQKLRTALHETEEYRLSELPSVLRLRGQNADTTLEELVRGVSLGLLPPCKPIGSDNMADAVVSGSTLLRYLESDGPQGRFVLV
jgi:hypothetical protein